MYWFLVWPKNPGYLAKVRHLKTQSTHTLKKMHRKTTKWHKEYQHSQQYKTTTDTNNYKITTKYHKVTENNYKKRQLKYIAFVFLAIGADGAVVSESSPSCQKVIKYESL